jgi:hypothetical protein
MWDVELVTILRYLIGDFSDTPKFTDDRLAELILVAAQNVYQELNFNTVYTIRISQLYLSPDPTINRDDDFIKLTCLKAASILTQGEARLASGGLMWKDDNTQVDTRSQAVGKRAMSQDFKKDYEDARWDYQLGKRHVGSAVLNAVGLVQSWYINSSDFRSRVSKL